MAHVVYIAAVIDGIEPRNFRGQLRETMITIEHEHTAVLRHYDGNAEPFMASAAAFAALLTYAEEPPAALITA